MTKEKQIELLAAAIEQLRHNLFIERMEEAFWQVQCLTGSKQFEQVLGMSQTKIRIMENKLPYWIQKLKDIESGNYVYEEEKRKK